MAVLIALVLAVLAVAFIAVPFLLVTQRSASTQEAEADAERAAALRDLQAEKETIYEAIQELDFDFKSGKLSAEDHEALRTRHEAQAAAVLQRIDALDGAGAAEQPRQGARERRRA
jgi:flagellar biosynthesis/type III secretory pathway M-ring protein FliF/YscJ